MDRKVSRLCLSAAAVSCILIVAPEIARAQMAVLDSANLAQTSQTLAQTIKLLNEATQTVQQLTSVSGALGSMGAAATGSGLATPIRSATAAMALPQLNFDSWNLPRDLQNPNMGSFNSARDFLSQTLTVTPDKSKSLAFGGVDAARQRRSLAAGDAAMNGYALALQQRQTLQPALARAAGLADQATAATTLMDQQRATNYLLAQIAGELTAERALIAALLELQSARALEAAPVVFRNSPSSGFGAPATSQSSGQLGE